jgi:uncharacterized protein (DUF433 family)
MNWHGYISPNSKVLGGKPAVRDTRLAVEFILGLFGEGWSQEEVLDNYPSLTPESLQAVFAFAAEILEDRLYVHPTDLPARG